MKGHLRRCRLRIRSSRTTQYAPVRCSPAPGDPPSKIETQEVPEGGIWPFLNRLNRETFSKL